MLAFPTLDNRPAFGQLEGWELRTEDFPVGERNLRGREGGLSDLGGGAFLRKRGQVSDLGGSHFYLHADVSSGVSLGRRWRVACLFD